MQRFLVAILQKCSIKKELIPVYVEFKLIDWSINMIKRSLKVEIHPFVQNFGSAILPCIVHSPSTEEYLQERPKKVIEVIFYYLSTYLKVN